MKPANKPMAGAAAGGGIGIGVIVSWLWNWGFPDYPMTGEVAAAVGGVSGPILAYATQWLPRPDGE